MPVIARAVGVALLACAFAAACDDAPTPKAASDGSAPAKPASKEAAIPANMVAAVSAGRTSTSISLHFALEAVPSVGKPLPVAIAVVPHRPFTSVRALFEAPDAVIMATGNEFEPKTDVKAETMLPHKLVLQPTQEGVFLVTAAVETEGEEGTVTRIYSIPVIVHSATEAPAPPASAPAANPESGTPAG